MTLVIYLFFSSRNEGFLSFSWPYILGFSTFLGIISFFQTRYIFRELRAMSVTVTQSGVIQRFRKKQIETPWNTIQKVQIAYSIHRELLTITLFTNQRIPIVLAGFEGMDTVLQEIEQFISRELPRETKQQRLNWQSPLAPWLILFGKEL